MNNTNLEPIAITNENYFPIGLQKFHLDVFQEGPRGKIIRHKKWRDIITKLHKDLPFTKQLFDFKGRRKLPGSWETVNIDLAQFSTQFPGAMFEITRYETANVTKGNETKLRNLVTKIDVLNGSINIFTLVETDLPTSNVESNQSNERKPENELPEADSN